jgi:hypothetical protein
LGSPYGREEPPVDLSALDPPLQEFLIFALLEPFPDEFLYLFLIPEECHHLFILFHLSPIPLALLLWFLEISLQLLLKFLQRNDLECQTLLHLFASHLQRIGQIVQEGEDKALIQSLHQGLLGIRGTASSVRLPQAPVPYPGQQLLYPLV